MGGGQQGRQGDTNRDNTAPLEVSVPRGSLNKKGGKNEKGQMHTRNQNKKAPKPRWR